MNWTEFLTNWWRELVFGGIAAALTVAVKGLYGKLRKRIKDESEEQKAIKRGVVAMLHDRLRQACLYHLRRGKISASELDNSRKMYEAYAGLGGNGTVKELYERCLRLPLAQENEI